MPSLRFILTMLCVAALLGGTNSYIARRTYQCVGFAFPGTPAWPFSIFAIVSALLLVFSFARSMLPVSPALKHILAVGGMNWMGIFIYLFLFMLLSDAVLLILRIARLIPAGCSLARFISVIAAVLLTAVTVIVGIHNAKHPAVTEYEVPLSAPASGMNIVLISDVHLGALGSEQRLDSIVSGINSLEPDLVCIAGDIFDNDFTAIRNPERAAALLRSIDSTYGVYACTGNHDAGSTQSAMLAFLKNSNITLLCDEYTVIDDRITLVGRLDPSPIGGFGGRRRAPLADVLAGHDPSLPVVVMDHNPANCGEYGAETALVLSGHTHKGQLFPGSIFTNFIYAVDHGIYRADESSPYVIVSSGAGTWGMPMRVGTKSEIVRITSK